MAKKWLEKPLPRILVVRNDGLGDFILTLPLIASLKSQLPHAHIEVLISQRWQPLLSFLPQISGSIVDGGVLLKRDTHKSHKKLVAGSGNYADLLKQIKAKQFDVALLPYAEPKSAALIHQAKIPHRVGPLRRHFFWRFNHFVSTSSRKSTLSEYALKLKYLSALGLKPAYAPPALALEQQSIRRTLSSQKPHKQRVLLHPIKKTGTALSWSPQHYVLLAQGLVQEGYEVGVLGEMIEGTTLSGWFQHLPVQYHTGLTLDALVRLLVGTDLFVGNSSGPLHLAALLNTPHIGLYPQNRVDSARRWRTLPSQEEWLLEESKQEQRPPSHNKSENEPENVPLHARWDATQYLLQPTLTKNCVLCSKQRCPYFNCMDTLSPEAVLAQARSMLTN